MTLEIGLGLVGIIVSVLLAFLAIKKIYKNRTQKQIAKGSGTVIQSGRDTKVG